jgi:steroid delta-isomerase-like uncharacterized protein
VTREDIVALLERRQQALARHDTGALTALHTLDSTLESVMGPPLCGRADIEQFYRRLFEAFPDFHYQPTELIVDGDRAVQVATFEGTHSGTFMGMPASGRRVRVPGVFLFTIQGSEIARLRSVYDFTGLLVQAGVLRIKPA